MTEDFEISQGKTAGDLGREALWYTIHTLLAVLILMLVVLAFWAAHIDPESVNPKILCTVLACFIPMLGGFVIAKVRQDDPAAETARYVWISGLLFFSLVCVWVLDLPTGPGLCEHCGAVSKLTRTFFEISNGSGLMGGDGLLVGTWVPLSMIGYAIGAKFGLDS